ncbi:hypothetical protein OJF2_04980 [Aquisphaera giovannonii]|uniref:Uncharacterized protein n=1 Tax=Aquisphaera giovannonii TaxID=406548 RepID=A0A5B9VV64_9BACT|nr:hypothetical protein OJF2_04980 [Aquisphaera giovannonii]
MKSASHPASGPSRGGARAASSRLPRLPGHRPRGMAPPHSMASGLRSRSGRTRDTGQHGGGVVVGCPGDLMAAFCIAAEKRSSSKRGSPTAAPRRRRGPGRWTRLLPDPGDFAAHPTYRDAARWPANRDQPGPRIRRRPGHLPPAVAAHFDHPDGPRITGEGPPRRTCRRCSRPRSRPPRPQRYSGRVHDAHRAGAEDRDLVRSARGEWLRGEGHGPASGVVDDLPDADRAAPPADEPPITARLDEAIGGRILRRGGVKGLVERDGRCRGRPRPRRRRSPCRRRRSPPCR